MMAQTVTQFIAGLDKADWFSIGLAVGQIVWALPSFRR